MRTESKGGGKPSQDEAPDGGWGWAVIAGSVLVNFLLFGQNKAFGIYFSHLMSTFDASASRVAWIQSLQMSVFTLTAPVSSLMSETLGARAMGLLGGLAGCLGMVLSSAAPSLEVLYFTYGIMQGFAMALTFTPGVMILSSYFHRRRGLANGINMAGNALGGIVMPLVVNVLLETYGLSGGLLVMGGILLNACVGVSLWRPLEVKVIPEEVKQPVVEQEQCHALAKRISGKRILVLKCTAIRRSNIFPEEPFTTGKYKLNAEESPLYIANLQVPSHILDAPPSPTQKTLPKEYDALSEFHTSSKHRHCVDRTGSVASSLLYVSSLQIGPNMAPECQTRQKADQPTPNVQKRWSTEKLIDTAVLRNGSFYIITTCLFFHQLGYSGTQTYLPLRGLSMGLTQSQAATLLSAVAFADFLGRLVCGWLSDLQVCPRKYWFMGGMFMSAVFTFCMQFAQDYVSLLLCSVAFGLSAGSYIGLILAMFGDLFGAHRLGFSYSTSVLFSGGMSLAGPPFLGFVLERTSSYSVLQSILGCAQLAGCAVWLLEPLTRKMDTSDDSTAAPPASVV